jgi:glycosyltransferase involved in cell wall biosynthesis
VIRTDHYRDSFPPTIRSKLLLTRLTDGILTFSEKARSNIIRQFGIAPERVARINPALDCDAFHPASGSRALRQELGIGDHDLVVGVISRFQKYRKMDLFFEALAMAVKTAPHIKALLVGRGHMQETVVEPLQKLGLEKNVIRAGYLTDRYRDGIASMDVLVFLIAGSDGTARAMREAMGMGKPIIANNLGMLPELIEDGINGLVFNDNARELANHLVTLARDDAKRRAMGEAARIRALAIFSLTDQAQALESFYERILRKQALKAAVVEPFVKC